MKHNKNTFVFLPDISRYGFRMGWKQFERADGPRACAPGLIQGQERDMYPNVIAREERAKKFLALVGLGGVFMNAAGFVLVAAFALATAFAVSKGFSAPHAVRCMVWGGILAGGLAAVGGVCRFLAFRAMRGVRGWFKDGVIFWYLK